MLHRARGEKGFTLVELLAVILIVGILAAIATSTFLSKRLAAGDAGAKQLVSTAEQTAQTYVLENGSTGMTPAALNAAERTINITPNGQTVLVNATPISTGYILTVVSSTADTFNMTNASGLLTRSCIVAAGNGNTATNTGGGCRSGTW